MATTQILPALPTDGHIFHQSGPRRASPSESSLFLAHSPPSSLSSSPKPQSIVSSAQHRERISERISTPPPQPSTEPPPTSSTDAFSRPSPFNSTSISSDFSLPETLEAERQQQEDNDDITFPNYDSLQLSIPDSAYSKSSSRAGDDESDAPEISTTTDTTQSDSPLPTPIVADDTMIQEEPSRHVDYLSYDWREEDIWASWRHVVARRYKYGQKSRLENASWRTWAKSKFQLQTVSPEKLNWLKESDVTWLYGPLQPAQSHPITSDTSTPPSNLSKSSSFVKKPILKKRSMSEVMLQKSISSSSLVKQAAAAVQAQNSKQPKRTLSRTTFEFAYTPSIPPSQPPSREDDYFSRRASDAEPDTPSEGKEKHIRFDEVVEQCVSINMQERGFDEESEPEAEDDPSTSALSESSSDEGLVMMKRKREGPRRDSTGKARLSRTNSSSKMIETIPATTLKYRTDSPDVTEEAQHHHVFGKHWGAGKLSPSPSQETLRPSRPSRNFLLGEDDDEDADGESSSWSFGSSNPRSSLGESASAQPSSSRGRPDHYNPSVGLEGLEGMRRTESGMFMPIEEDEDDMVAAGLFGRVSETVNTVRDIGWVLWNVGWRK